MEVRAFRSTDTDACYEICVRTAAAGGDARGLHTDHRLPGEVWVAPYLRHAPDLAWVVADDDGTAVGYVVGAAHTTEHEDWAEAEWWPPLRARYPQGGFPAGTADADTVDLIHTPPRMDPAIVATHPAHLHIDLLPAAQGVGFGRQLLDALFSGLRDAGAGAVHLGVAPENTGAIAFYERLGFEVLVPGFTLYGRSTAPRGDANHRAR